MAPFTPLPFVGRKDELKKFNKMLDDPNHPWLMWIVGPAGQGKSRLLETFLAECQVRGLKHSGMLDFFNDNLRTRSGVMIELARRFRVDHNPAFKVALEKYQEELAKEEQVDLAVLKHLEKQVEQTLVSILCSNDKLLQVVITDTVELVADGALGQWFFSNFIPQLFPHFRIVAAGRTIPSVTSEIEWPGLLPVRVNLEDLSIGDVRQYFQKYFEEREQPDNPIDEASIRRVHELTKGTESHKRGQPLLVALVCQALHDDWQYFLQISQTNDQQAFEDALFDQLLNTEKAEGRVILELAHIYHGLAPEFLESKYTLIELGAPSYAAFQDRLVSLPIIKFHSDTGVIRLHDYFRDRLNETSWPILDPDLTLRTQISQQLLPLLEAKVHDLISDHRRITELDTTRLHRLYHLLFVNREQAYGEIWELLDSSWHAYKLDYMDQLLAIAQQVNMILRPVGQFDLVLDRIEKAARAWMYLETWHTQEALQLAEVVVSDSAGVRRLYLSALVAKGTALGRLGKVDEGIQALFAALDGYEELFALTKVAEAGDDKRVRRLASEHGIATSQGIRPERYLILNTIGFLERQRSRFDKAGEAFAKSFELSTYEGDRLWRASAATQLGTVARYQGEMARAYDYIEKGLAIRRSLGQPGQEAFSLQALGMLQRDNNLLLDARKTFNHILEVWKGLGAEFYVASTLRNLGWVDYLEHKYDDAEQNYQNALAIYQRLNSSRELPSLLHKWGVLCKERAREAENLSEQEAYLRQAEAYLQEGLQLGKKYIIPLYAALCLTDLCDLAEGRSEYDQMLIFASELREYEEQGYLFAPAYAHLEQILGNAALRQANIGQPSFDLALFDEAVDHYCQMFVYLVHHDENRYRRHRRFLRQWLPSLHPDLRQRAAKRLIECWQSQPDNLAKRHPGLMNTAILMSDL